MVAWTRSARPWTTAWCSCSRSGATLRRTCCGWIAVILLIGIPKSQVLTVDLAHSTQVTLMTLLWMFLMQLSSSPILELEHSVQRTHQATTTSQQRPQPNPMTNAPVEPWTNVSPCVQLNQVSCTQVASRNVPVFANNMFKMNYFFIKICLMASILFNLYR